MVRVKSTPRKVEQHQPAAGVEARIKVSTSVTPTQIAHTEGQAAPGQEQQQKEQGQDDAVSGDSGSGDEDSMDILQDEFLNSDFKAADIHFEQFLIYEVTLEDKRNEISEKILSQFQVVHDKSGNVESYDCKRCLAREVLTDKSNGNGKNSATRTTRMLLPTVPTEMIGMNKNKILVVNNSCVFTI